MDYREIALPYKVKSSVLALGAQSKSSFCFAKGKAAYLSNSGGDLSDFGNFRKFENGIKKVQKRLKIAPNIIACDMHPEYIPTKYAKDKAASGVFGLEPRALSLKLIQHHEAHVASCLADNNIKGRVIGIAFDGAGYGSDGSIWGGEFFIGGLKGLKRIAHLRYVPMPGAEAAVREPWRMAFSYLYAIYGKKKLPRTLKRLAMTGRRWPRSDILGQMLDKKINSPLTSSAGRLFDAVSALIGVCDFAGYEGEAAIKLEKIIPAEGSEFKAQGRYSFKYSEKNWVTIIDWSPLIKGIVKDLKNDAQRSEISLKFHDAMCSMIKHVCKTLRKKYKIHRVCLSGGVFQNRYLSRAVKPMLEKEGFMVYVHKNIPTHDGGIALGQAVLAHQRLRF